MDESLESLKDKAQEAFWAFMAMSEKTPDEIKGVVRKHLNTCLWAVEHKLKEKE